MFIPYCKSNLKPQETARDDFVSASKHCLIGFFDI